MSRTPHSGRVLGTCLPRAQGKALLLDRDGVINVNHGYVHRAVDTEWVAGIFELCRAAYDAGFDLYVVTNQAGIARGYYDESQFAEYTRWLHARFEAEGAPVVATYYCPHHPEYGLGAYHVECDCRKPGTGMLRQAIEDFGFDPARSVMVGDSLSDMQAGGAAGINRLFWLTSPEQAGQVPPGVRCVAELGQIQVALSDLVKD